MSVSIGPDSRQTPQTGTQTPEHRLTVAEERAVARTASTENNEDFEDDEQKELDERLGEEFATELADYRRAEQKITARNTASISMSKNPL